MFNGLLLLKMLSCGEIVGLPFVQLGEKVMRMIDGGNRPCGADIVIDSATSPKAVEAAFHRLLGVFGASAEVEVPPHWDPASDRVSACIRVVRSAPSMAPLLRVVEGGREA